MYKIYVNDTPLILLREAEAENWPAGGDDRLLARYPGKPKFLLHYVDMLEKSRRFRYVALYSEDYDGLCRDFNAHFRIVGAAGGVVSNEAGEVLLIFRRGYWDLPKGKIDDGESPGAAAVREVQEETGLREAHLHELLDTTYHTYRERDGQRVLKRTYWYRMSTPQRDLLPQHEEDIEVAVWMTMDEFFGRERTVYGNIVDLLKKISEIR